MDFQTGVARHLVTLTAFLMQPQPPTLAVLEVISDSHTHRRSDPREAVDHGSDQRPISQAKLKYYFQLSPGACALPLQTAPASCHAEPRTNTKSPRRWREMQTGSSR